MISQLTIEYTVQKPADERHPKQEK